MLFKDILVRTRRALALYKVSGNSALLVLNGASLNSVNALLALSRRIVPSLKFPFKLIFKSEKSKSLDSKSIVGSNVIPDTFVHPF